MGYCFMTMKKLKTMTALIKTAEHNTREEMPLNADPNRTHLNDTLVKIDGADISEAWEKRLDKLEHYKTSKFQKRQVPALEILMSVPHEDAQNLDLEAWKKANLEWLKETFDVAGEKNGSNILSVEYHGDESNAHIHAIVTPVDERGRFYTDRWMGGRAAMAKQQTSYAKAMAPLGLERGLEHSKMKHSDIARLYAEIDRTKGAVERICEIQPGETLETYHDRIQESFLDRNIAMKRIMDDYKRETIEAQTKLENFQAQFSKVLTKDERNRVEHALKHKLPEHRETWEGIERTYGDIKTIKKSLEKNKLLEAGINNFPDRNRANILNDNIEDMIAWEKMYEREHEKDRQQREIRNIEQEEKLNNKAKKIETKIFGE